MGTVAFGVDEIHFVSFLVKMLVCLFQLVQEVICAFGFLVDFLRFFDEALRLTLSAALFQNLGYRFVIDVPAQTIHERRDPFVSAFTHFDQLKCCMYVLRASSVSRHLSVGLSCRKSEDLIICEFIR